MAFDSVCVSTSDHTSNQTHSCYCFASLAWGGESVFIGAILAYVIIRAFQLKCDFIQGFQNIFSISSMQKWSWFSNLLRSCLSSVTTAEILWSQVMLWPYWDSQMLVLVYIISSQLDGLFFCWWKRNTMLKCKQ